MRGALLSVGGPPAGSPTATNDDQWRSSFESVFLGPLRVARTMVAQLPDVASLCWVLSTSAKSPITGLAISNGLRPGLGHEFRSCAGQRRGCGGLEKHCGRRAKARRDRAVSF